MASVPTVAACQCVIDDLDVPSNRDRVVGTVRDLPDAVDLAVFPEQTLTGFVPDERIHDAALTRDGAAVTAVHEAAKAADCAVVVGFVEAAPDGYYNATAHLDPDGDRVVYRKRHLWGGERSLLEPGTERVRIETPVGTATILTCYDLNFVGESAATAAEAVAVLLVPGAWPAASSENWRLLVRARALDGVRWVVAAGRTGHREVANAPAATYAGRSLVVYPNGAVKEALTREPGRIVSELSPAALDGARDRIGVFEEVS
jgi:(R)-amidase